MARSRSRPIEDIELAYAAHPRKPGMIDHDAQRSVMLTHMPQPRVVNLPEPADGSWVNWRETEPWEFGLVVAGRLRERRAELALFEGLIG